jgi:hypothetical protein
MTLYKCECGKQEKEILKATIVIVMVNGFAKKLNVNVVNIWIANQRGNAKFKKNRSIFKQKEKR